MRVPLSWLADYVDLRSEGRVVDHGKPEPLWDAASDWSQQFMQGLADGPVAFHYPAPGFREDLLTGSH